MKQSEADALLRMEKHRATKKQYVPMPGDKLSCPLVAFDKSEKFSLDVYRGRIDLCKGTYQNRWRSTIILARLDFGGDFHRNPDGEKISSPHLHIYREGCGDRWAHPLPPEISSDVSDVWKIFEDFMRYCNITKPPHIQPGLFT